MTVAAAATIRIFPQVVVERAILTLFLVVVWGFPYPFQLAASEEPQTPVGSALSDIITIRALGVILTWTTFGLLTLYLIWSSSRSRARPVNAFVLYPGILWSVYLVAQVISIFFSPSPVYTGFRVYQSVVLSAFLIVWFGQEN